MPPANIKTNVYLDLIGMCNKEVVSIEDKTSFIQKQVPEDMTDFIGETTLQGDLQRLLNRLSALNKRL